jgi:hypothetical protein
MKVGSIQCQGIITLDGELILPPKGSVLEVGGIEIANITEIVINFVVHTKESDTTWIQKGHHRNIVISHDDMIRKARSAIRNTKRFNFWVSNNTLNIKDHRLGPYKNLIGHINGRV